MSVSAFPWRGEDVQEMLLLCGASRIPCGSAVRISQLLEDTLGNMCESALQAAAAAAMAAIENGRLGASIHQRQLNVPGVADLGATPGSAAACTAPSVRDLDSSVSRLLIRINMQMADGGESGKVELHELSAAFRRAECDADDPKMQLCAAARGGVEPYRLVEMQMTQLARIINARSFSLGEALSLFDLEQIGFLDMSEFAGLRRRSK